MLAVADDVWASGSPHLACHSAKPALHREQRDDVVVKSAALRANKDHVAGPKAFEQGLAGDGESGLKVGVVLRARELHDAKRASRDSLERIAITDPYGWL